MYTQNVDCKLDFHDINHIKEVYEDATNMKVGPRQPYAGELVFLPPFQALIRTP